MNFHRGRDASGLVITHRQCHRRPCNARYTNPADCLYCSEVLLGTARVSRCFLVIPEPRGCGRSDKPTAAKSHEFTTQHIKSRKSPADRDSWSLGIGARISSRQRAAHASLDAASKTRYRC